MDTIPISGLPDGGLMSPAPQSALLLPTHPDPAIRRALRALHWAALPLRSVNHPLAWVALENIGEAVAALEGK